MGHPWGMVADAYGQFLIIPLTPTAAKSDCIRDAVTTAKRNRETTHSDRHGMAADAR